MAGHDLLLPDLLRLLPANQPARLRDEHEADWPCSESGSSISNGGHDASPLSRSADHSDLHHGEGASTAIIPWDRTATSRGDDSVCCLSRSVDFVCREGFLWNAKSLCVCVCMSPYAKNVLHAKKSGLWSSCVEFSDCASEQGQRCKLKNFRLNRRPYTVDRKEGLVKVTYRNRGLQSLAHAA